MVWRTTAAAVAAPRHNRLTKGKLPSANNVSGCVKMTGNWLLEKAGCTLGSRRFENVGCARGGRQELAGVKRLASGEPCGSEV